jgi:hypothetical protein
MRHFTLATIAAAALTAAAALSVGSAQAWYGPVQHEGQCWHAHSGTGLGYWAPCESKDLAKATLPASSGHHHHHRR